MADYVSLLSQEYQGLPSLTQWLQVLTEPFNTNQALLATFPARFNLATATGNELDVLGQYIGADRYVELPITGLYAAFDTAGVGWDQGYWLPPYSPATSRQPLSDAQYRMVLAARILNNRWDGSIPHAYQLWDDLFPPGSPYTFFIQDMGQMSMVIGLASPTVAIDPLPIIYSPLVSSPSNPWG